MKFRKYFISLLSIAIALIITTYVDILYRIYIVYNSSFQNFIQDFNPLNSNFYLTTLIMVFILPILLVNRKNKSIKFFNWTNVLLFSLLISLLLTIIINVLAGAGSWGGTTFRSILTSRNLKLAFGLFVDTLILYLSYYLIKNIFRS